MKKNVNIPFGAKYFSLLNNVRLDLLTEEELKKVKNYYESIKMGNNIAEQELVVFLRANILKFLLPKTEENYLYWGIVDYQYMAPAKSIVLAFDYIAFDYEQEDDFAVYNFVTRKMNFIQEQYASAFEVPLSIIMYDESFEIAKASV